MSQTILNKPLRWAPVFAVALLSITSSTASAEVTVLTLDKSIGIALKQSQTIINQEYNLKRQLESLETTKRSLKPRISFSFTPISYSKSTSYSDIWGYYDREGNSQSGSLNVRQVIVATDGTLTFSNGLNHDVNKVEDPKTKKTTETKQFSNSFKVSYSQSVFTYNRQKLTLRNLELNLENNQISYALARLNLETSIATSFYNLYKQKRQLSIAKSQYENSMKNYELTQNKVAAGILAQSEVYQAEVTKANAELSYKSTLQSYEDALDNFKITLRIPLQDSIDVDANIVGNVVKIDAEQALANTLANSMTIRQREISMEQTKQNLMTAGATNEFAGTLSANFGLSDNKEDFGDLYSEKKPTQGISLSLDVPIWDWGEKKSRIRLAEMQVANQQLSDDETMKKLRINILQSVRELETLAERITIAETSLKAAELTYQINEEKYANGNMTAMDLNTSQQQYTTAQTNLMTAQINYRTSLLQLKVDTMWDFEKNQAVIPQYTIPNN
jgi:outer membrane protein